jgi:RNA polymerase sigma factor (sigma-70 family)
LDSDESERNRIDAGSADDPGPRPDDAAQPVAVLEDLLAARGEQLLRTALLAGSRADGEDLLQVPDGTDAVDQRDQVIRLLSALPPRRRIAVVLRHWEDLSAAEAARAMGCSVGTVKAACSRGLRRLRELSEGFTQLSYPLGATPAKPAPKPGASVSG